MALLWHSYGLLCPLVEAFMSEESLWLCSVRRAAFQERQVGGASSSHPCARHDGVHGFRACAAPRHPILRSYSELAQVGGTPSYTLTQSMRM